MTLFFSIGVCMKLLVVSFLIFLPVFSFAKPNLDTEKIEQLTGLKGKFDEAENTFKVSNPRKDVKVTVEGWSMPPFMGLTSWAGFTTGKKTSFMVMGDLVLFQDEVNPVMSTLFENGIAVTALHNHFFYDDPKVFFMHISAEGNIEKLAAGIRKAFDTVKELRAKNPMPAKSFGGQLPPEKSAITAQVIEDILGIKGDSNDGMFKAVIGRKAKLSCGCDVGKDMGINTWAAFAGADDNAFVDGDFAVLESELQPVLRALRENKINIVAIHHHMTEEKPRILFLHYWGHGKTQDLANGIKAALEKQKGIKK